MRLWGWAFFDWVELAAIRAWSAKASHDPLDYSCLLAQPGDVSSHSDHCAPLRFLLSLMFRPSPVYVYSLIGVGISLGVFVGHKRQYVVLLMSESAVPVSISMRSACHLQPLLRSTAKTVSFLVFQTWRKLFGHIHDLICVWYLGSTCTHCSQLAIQWNPSMRTPWKADTAIIQPAYCSPEWIPIMLY